MIEASTSRIGMRDIVELELAQHDPSASGSALPPVVIVDDAEQLDEGAIDVLKRASETGALLVVIAPRAAVEKMLGRPSAVFIVPPIDASASAELLQRAVPSLPDALRTHLVEHVGSRPGSLRAAVRRLAGKAIVSKEDVDVALAEPSTPSVAPVSSGRAQTLEAAERGLDLGRFDDAARELDALGEPRARKERMRMGLARARIAVERGDPQRALIDLVGIEADALAGEDRRAWQALRARVYLRAGQYADAAKLAQVVIEAAARDTLAADALSVRGVALAYMGDDARASEVLDEAVRVARHTGLPRVEAVALGSAAIAHQRAGRTNDARRAYEASLAAAEQAGNAGTVAAMRLNLAVLTQGDGDFAQALVHLEAAVDMGRRAGTGGTVTQALLNLANQLCQRLVSSRPPCYG